MGAGIRGASPVHPPVAHAPRTAHRAKRGGLPTRSLRRAAALGGAPPPPLKDLLRLGRLPHRCSACRVPSRKWAWTWLRISRTWKTANWRTSKRSSRRQGRKCPFEKLLSAVAAQRGTAAPAPQAATSTAGGGSDAPAAAAEAAAAEAAAVPAAAQREEHAAAPGLARGKRFAAFLSHHKVGAAMEARYVKGAMTTLLGGGAPAFLDSDNLNDLNQLLAHGAAPSLSLFRPALPGPSAAPTPPLASDPRRFCLRPLLPCPYRPTWQCTRARR